SPKPISFPTRRSSDLANKLILTEKAVMALKKVEAELNKEGLGLKVFDAYRPQRAVNHFKRWAKDIKDTLMRREFYPQVDKRDLRSEEHTSELQSRENL